MTVGGANKMFHSWTLLETLGKATVGGEHLCGVNRDHIMGGKFRWDSQYKVCCPVWICGWYWSMRRSCIYILYYGEYVEKLLWRKVYKLIWWLLFYNTFNKTPLGVTVPLTLVCKESLLFGKIVTLSRSNFLLVNTQKHSVNLVHLLVSLGYNLNSPYFWAFSKSLVFHVLLFCPYVIVFGLWFGMISLSRIVICRYMLTFVYMCASFMYSG